MLQDLVDRLLSGTGIDVTVIQIPTNATSDPVQARILSLMDKLTASRNLVDHLCNTYRHHGYGIKAVELKSWFDAASAEARAVIDKVGQMSIDSDPETYQPAVEELSAALEKAVPFVAGRLRVLTDRQKIAVCEVDIADMLV